VCLMCGYSGAPKTWYSVPGSAASDFEKVMQKAFPDLFEAQPDLLFQLVTMLSPEVVRDNGVPVCTAVQVPHSVHFPFCDFCSTSFNVVYGIRRCSFSVRLD
jgi:histone demethylase JARID1